MRVCSIGLHLHVNDHQLIVIGSSTVTSLYVRLFCNHASFPCYRYYMRSHLRRIFQMTDMDVLYTGYGDNSHSFIMSYIYWYHSVAIVGFLSFVYLPRINFTFVTVLDKIYVLYFINCLHYNNVSMITNTL